VTEPASDAEPQHAPRIRIASPQEQQRLRATVTDAPLLELTEVTDHVSGRLLAVQTVGILDEPHIRYIRLTDGRTLRLPDLLWPWADSLIRVHLHNIKHDQPPLLPALIEFGVIDGRALAELREAISGTG
jgi:hypothetical protein